MSGEPLKFVGASASPQNADIIIAGIPYDETSTFRKGSKTGPVSIREFSDSIETYSPEQGIDIADMKLCDAGDMVFAPGGKKEVLVEIGEFASETDKKGKKAIYFGGEHLVSVPLVKKYAEKHEGLKVIYFDAHADMRDDYDGEKYSHATAARRISEIVGKENIFLFGIRSFEKNEAAFIRDNRIFMDPDFSEFLNLADTIKDRPVYISIDIDVFDPSCVPGVGNPEPGGITYNDFARLIPGFETLNNIVAADIVEVAPAYDPPGISSVLAAKVAREIIAVMG